MTPVGPVSDSKAILKYALIHLAELLLVLCALALARRFLGISTWLVITIIVLWILKDVALFPKVWKAYAVGDKRPTSRLIGLEATVIHNLDPVGYVRVRGELWRAESRDRTHPVKKGEKTRVVDIRGMTLVVERR